MKMTVFPRLVGVIHLPALPGSPGCTQAVAAAIARATRQAVGEAKTLEGSGFDALIIENFGDNPFFPTVVPPITVSAMSVIASSVRDVTKLPLGINVLRNDGRAALAIAAVTGAQFIRVNVLSGVAATDQGVIEGDAANLMRERAMFEAQGTRVQVWGDAMVKHARSLSVDDIEVAVEEVAVRARGDAVIVTGTTTGRAIEMTRLQAAARNRTGAPLYLGSGATPENVASLAKFVHGVIVGSALRQKAMAGAPLDGVRIRKFVRAWRERH